METGITPMARRRHNRAALTCIPEALFHLQQ